MTFTAELVALARSAATSPAHWQRFFEALRADWPVDRICAALQVDPYTAYLPRVAQLPELEPILGGDGLYGDREHSRTFGVIAEGRPHLVTEEDWKTWPDLKAYGVVMKSNLKLPVSFGGWPTVWNLWSRQPGAYTEEHRDAFAELAAELGRSPFRFEPVPVGIALRRAAALAESRQGALAA